MLKVEFMLQLFMVSIFAFVALFAMPFVVSFGGREREETSAAGLRTPYKLPEAEAVWGGIALLTWSLYVVIMQGTNLKALALGIGMALGVLPASFPV